MIATVISFCTNEIRFFRLCVEAVIPFSDQIIVPVCDHFYDGTEENYGLLEKLYREYPQVEFLEFSYDPQNLYGSTLPLTPDHPDWGHQWHNTSRLVAFYHLKEEIHEVIFCDVDEIFEAEKFLNWQKQFDRSAFSILRFATYWYFREARFQAVEWPDGPVLVKKSFLEPELLLDEDERMGLYLRLQGEKRKGVCGIDLVPMVHHFSWVRTKEEMIKKTHSWGHHWERNWPKLIDEEFSSPFTGKDFVRKYTYQEITPSLDPLEEKLPETNSRPTLEEHRESVKKMANVHLINAKDIFRRDLIRRI